MDRASEYLLAGAAFAEEQNGGIAGGCLSSQINGLLHLGAFTDNQLIAFAHLLGKDLDAALQPLSLQRFSHEMNDMLGFEWSGDEIVSALVHRFVTSLRASAASG